MSLKRNEYVAMKIVRKDVLSNKSSYVKLLARLHDLYLELDSDYISTYGASSLDQMTDLSLQFDVMNTSKGRSALSL